MVTLFVNVGRKDKVRPGDIVGALTASSQVLGDQIGKITVFDKFAYVSVKQENAQDALVILSGGKIKGREIKARRLR